MAPVPEAYYQFVMDYAPYVYVVPGSGPDSEWGRAAFAAAFAVDFLFEAYFDAQFDDRSAEIEDKIVELASLDINSTVHGQREASVRRIQKHRKQRAVLQR